MILVGCSYGEICLLPKGCGDEVWLAEDEEIRRLWTGEVWF
ncbi:MAG: hypothetical protein SAK42_04200 [Oscillatoria sp. PMC 1076.18]|nr:hypothetical protein [Oscillatoria sp. PMC 1076.18]